VHGVPSGAGTLEHDPVAGSQVPATWQESLGGQLTGFAPTHVPPVQANDVSQRLLLEHAVPSDAAGLVHWPVAGSQVPAWWHVSVAVHATGFEPAHAPLWQVYVWLHGFVPVQVAPSLAAGFEHCPLAGSQVPATWHASLAVQVTRLAPVHVPARQVSLCVHALPSVHAVPSEALGLEHVPELGSHVPAMWHASLAAHVT
jgi:hypothetical protein